jgi:hypothetical protein
MSVQLNFALAWIWIVAGVLSGAALGSFFHKDGWLGGYASPRRRMYRLGHISFFGLSILNLLFAFTVRAAGLDGDLMRIASYGFALGAVTMPICCLLMAHAPRLRLVFAVPVTSLLVATVITAWGVSR